MTDDELTESVHQAQTMLKNTFRRVNEKRIAEALVHLARENRLLRDRLGLLERLNGKGTPMAN